MVSSTSPSVYVVYYNLAASADCYPSKVPLGSYSSVTIAYPPDAIRTLQTCSVTGNYQPVNYTQLYYPQANSIAAPGCSVAFGDPVDPAASNIQSNPIFSQPNEILSFDSRWLPCSDMYTPQFGIYDPPYALSKVTGQLVTSVRPSPTTPPATPGQAGSPAAPRPTGPVVLSRVSQDPSLMKSPLPTALPNNPAPTAIATPPQADPGASSGDKSLGDPKPIATPALSPGADSPRPTPSPQGGQDPPVITQPTAIGFQTVQQAPNGGIAGAHTVALPVDPASPLPTVAGNPIITAPSGGVVVGGITITAGGAAATVGGTVISVLPSSGGLIVGGSTVAVPVAPQPPLPTLGGQQFQAGPNSAIIIGGTTVTPGRAPMTLGGTTFSVPVNGGGIVVNGNTMTIPPAPAATPPVVGGQQVQAGPSGVVIGTNILSAGGPAVTVSGTVISALRGGSSIVVNGNTVPLAVVPVPTRPIIAGQTVQIGPNGAVIIGGTTITAGGPPAIISGTIISVLPSGGGLVVGASGTIILAGALPSAVNIGTDVLTYGAPARTISGTLFSLGASGLEVGSAFVPITMGEVGNLGGIIYSAFGGSLGASPTRGKSNGTALTTTTATLGGSSSTGLQVPTGSATTSGPASARTNTTGDAGRAKDDIWLGMHAWFLLLAALWTAAMT